MSLGEAFVEIRADLRPFGRDLKAGVKPMVEAFERELNNAVGRAAIAGAEDNGRKIGDGLSRGIKRSMANQLKDKNIFLVLAAALGSALDDGISALPTEVKAAIVAGLILAAPILAAFLTGLVTSLIGASVVGIGVALASQFDEVQTAATRAGRNIRAIFVSAAQSFGPAVINALALIESRLHGMQELFNDIFEISASFVDPLVHGLLEGFQRVVEQIRHSIGDLGPFVQELGVALTVILDAVAKSISILAASGDDGVTALRDLATIFGVLLISVSIALTVFTKFYNVIRDVISFIERYLGGLSIPIILLGRFFEMIDDRSNRQRSFINSNEELANSFDGLVSSTDAEIQELKKYSSAIEKLSDGIKNQVQLNISWEESLDRITESLKENGKTLDIGTEKGRANAQEFLRALEIAEKRTIEALQRGEISSEEAALQYDQQTEALRRMAVQAGIAEQDFNALFNEIIETGKLRISTEEMGLTAVTSELTGAGDRAQRLLELLHLIKHLSSTIGAGALGGVKGFSEGGIQYMPTVANIAEDGPEAIIPLTKPARAAQIMAQSGLSKMLGGSEANTFMVFIGNEQLDSRVVRIVEGNNTKQALALSHGGRML